MKKPPFEHELSPVIWTVKKVPKIAVAIFGIIFYSYNMIIAVWRSAAKYDKSICLAQLARLGILLAIFLVWYPILMR